MMKRFVLLGLAMGAFAACGDDGGDTDPDARVIDAAETDADDTDAPPAVTHAGSISLLEVQVLNPGTSGTFFGQGVQVGVAFTASDQVPGPVLEEMAGSPLGCKAWEYTPAQAAAATIGQDQGPVQVTAAAGLTPAMVPTCVHMANVGYICPHTMTAHTGGIVGAGPQPGTLTFTDADVTYNANNTTNRYLQIAGATNPRNNGVFPIVGLAGANTIVIGNPGGMAETLPATATHVNLAGIGPTPGVADPGFLANDATVTFMLTSGGGMDFDTFTSVNSGAGGVGDDFTLATAEAIKLNAIPRDGAAFTVTCDAAGCPAGTADGTVLNIVTTDTATAGLSPFAMPPPTTKRVQIRCAALGSSAITVPAAYSAFIMNSGATRIQASFIRGDLMGGGPPEVSAVSGHAVVGFTN